jgi:hypothetical protein
VTSQNGPVADPEEPEPTAAPELPDTALTDVSGGAFPVNVNDGITDSIT